MLTWVNIPMLSLQLSQSFSKHSLVKHFLLDMDFSIFFAIIFTFLWNPCKSIDQRSLEDIALKSEDFYEMCRSTNQLLAQGLSLDQAIAQVKKDFKDSLDSFIWNEEPGRGKPLEWESDRIDADKSMTVEIYNDPGIYETLKKLIQDFLTFFVEVFFSLMVVTASEVLVHDTNKSHTLILGKRSTEAVDQESTFIAFPCGLLQFPERIDPYHSKENREALLKFQENLIQVHQAIQLMEFSSFDFDQGT